MNMKNYKKSFEILGGYDREEKLSKICDGLKINESFKIEYLIV